LVEAPAHLVAVTREQLALHRQAGRAAVPRATSRAYSAIRAVDMPVVRNRSMKASHSTCRSS
jgi:hypothetical protein